MDEFCGQMIVPTLLTFIFVTTHFNIFFTSNTKCVSLLKLTAEVSKSRFSIRNRLITESNCFASSPEASFLCPYYFPFPAFGTIQWSAGNKGPAACKQQQLKFLCHSANRSSNFYKVNVIGNYWEAVRNYGQRCHSLFECPLSFLGKKGKFHGDFHFWAFSYLYTLLQCS